MKIGLEIHVELDTDTKLFCGCPRSADQPNTATCPTCLGHPGSRPRTNKQAITHAITAALALDATVHDELVFARKSYFYPDMPKNYQITQYDEPLATNGEIQLEDDTIPVTRLHVEEDPAALHYPRKVDNSEHVLIDYNRAGTPLLEVVTEPDITSAEHARDVITALTNLLDYLDVYNSDTCTVKTDANISIPNGERVEVKNIGGAREVANALHYEATRQENRQRRGLNIERETRAWNGTTTTATRAKEEEQEYGYVNEPDLPITNIQELTDTVRDAMPVLPRERERRYTEHGAAKDDAHVISRDQALADLYETLQDINPALVAEWLRREYLRVLNYHDRTPAESNVDAGQLRELLELLNDDAITDDTGQDVMERLVEDNISPRQYVKHNDLRKVDEEASIRQLCHDVIQENPGAVHDYTNGEDKALNYLVGQVMQASDGRADPSTVKHELQNELE